VLIKLVKKQTNVPTTQRGLDGAQRWKLTDDRTDFFDSLSIYGPQYKRSKREIYHLLDFIFGQAKLAFWLSRKSKIGGMGQTDVVLIYEGLRKSMLRTSGGGSTESRYLSKSTNNQINIYFSKSRSNTKTTILK